MCSSLRYFFLLSVLLLALPLTLSQPPFQSTEGVLDALRLEVPIIEYHKANTSFSFHVHVHNGTTGVLIRPEDLDYCQLHLYDPETGDHIIDEDNGNMTYDPGEMEFEYDATAGNFSKIGQYAVLVYCIDGEVGGFFEYPFYVTRTGETYTDYQNDGVYALMALAFFLFLLGNSFSKEKWKLRSFFYLMALLLSIIVANVVLLLFSLSPSLILMGQVALIVLIVTFSIFIVYILISYTIEVINQIKNVKKERMEKSDPY